MSYLTQTEEEQINAILKKANKRSQQTEMSSKEGFFSWLKSVSLGHIIVKLIDVAWRILRKIFGL